MRLLDPQTLLVASLMVALSLILIVMSTRVGLGAAARGMRTWLVGDVLLLAGQSSTALDAVPGWASFQPAPLTWTSGLVIAGIACHLVAIARHRRGTTVVGAHWLLAAPALGLAIGVVSAQIGEIAIRAILFNAVLATMLLTAIWRELRPVRRFLGVRIMIAAMLFAVTANLLMLASALARPDAVPQGATTGLLINMAMTMLTTSAFVLWLQEELRESLHRIAQTDPLTGVLNRHGLLPQLQRELARSGRLGPALSVVLCDIDHFKRINDVHGHAAGDAVLREFAESLRSFARASDLVARWGGEEFLLVLPDTDAQAAKAVMQRIAAQQAAASSSPIAVTFSAGVASTGGDGAPVDADTLLASADARLYVAKSTRNTIVAA